MGLTFNSVGIKAADKDIITGTNEYIIALAGNPNVGKSTVFNGLTGLNQHTGNWPGKTVSSASGKCKSKKREYTLVDIPGTYSLFPHSAEEEVARDFLCFSKPDAVIVVCDATCLERNLNLVLQILEITSNVIVCVNLLDEAKRKGIKINLKLLSERLKVPVVGTVAQDKKSLSSLLEALDEVTEKKEKRTAYRVKYDENTEKIIEHNIKRFGIKGDDKCSDRWLSLRIADSKPEFKLKVKDYIENVKEITDNDDIKAISEETVVSALIKSAEEICKGVITKEKTRYSDIDRKIDKIFTSRLFGYPIMIVLLAFIFWLTIVGANYPSQLLSKLLFSAGDKISLLFKSLKFPLWLNSMLVDGIYRVVAWVISVMLPPMAIFFPLFTLLEDAGYLPRVAFNLDRPLKKCNACGKQALTVCMGFGCNAAGVVGCRIIDSKRERLLAVITNSFIPCNGRFPTITALITMFFIGVNSNRFSSLFSALLLTAFILLSLFVTFLITKILSKTLLKGEPSSFALEMPPYRKPQIGRVIVSSVFDRTLFVLSRAIAVAAPAGLIIWLFTNITAGGSSILKIVSDFIEPAGALLGLDGVILLAFILGFPANEIVLPIAVMSYLSSSSLCELSGTVQTYNLLTANGWTFTTAICFILFSLMHWPCSTTLLTIKKETGSLKWTAVSFLIPTLTGMIICFSVNMIIKFFCLCL